jgi:hypothetical protein
MAEGSPSTRATAVAALDNDAYFFARGTFWLVFLDEAR